MSQLEGTLIAGRYEIREHIATGGMASVFKTWDHRVERIVAIKVLRSLDKNDLRAVERFRREARAAAALAHPNAVTIYDFVEEGGQYFLVMEYIQGPTLKQLITQRRRLQVREAFEIACQVCSVLQVAHARGFIHRDIKPQNIMLTWNGITPHSHDLSSGLWVKLTDFGIVRVAEDAGLTNSGIVLGTADYLSPEQARGETLTASSDLYSLGVVLFEMLAGRPPFVGPTAVSIAMQHASTNPPLLRQFNPSLPVSVERVVMRALEKEPEERFHSALELQQALRSCLRELVQQGHPAVVSPWQGLATPTGGAGPLFPPQRGQYL
ncbi:protein kinase domain-containing protein [Thermogemmatispora sp.]|uniref:protein kinase domain-containing protein n=1 Tax=Thermogemmatispora sp. TaxID=1968838 RepID=UPI001D367F9B|nr:protein kinase [Thermogemmatispora sp.]MBX5448605.1 serine/threonine protein kinase [Thermogemmatispora sp.]